jgi:uracil DNA glycosylase
MITVPKDLQKQNFYDALKKMHSAPGWEIFEENNVLALKSPARLPFVNMVWGDATIGNINKMTSFYS